MKQMGFKPGVKGRGMIDGDSEDGGLLSVQ